MHTRFVSACPGGIWRRHVEIIHVYLTYNYFAIKYGFRLFGWWTMITQIKKHNSIRCESDRRIQVPQSLKDINKVTRFVERVVNVKVACMTLILYGMWLSGPIRFFCPYSECPKFYNTKKLLTQHYMVRSRDMRMSISVFIEMNNWMKWLVQKSHNPKNEECEQCGARFALKRDRVYHQKKRLDYLFIIFEWWGGEVSGGGYN